MQDPTTIGFHADFTAAAQVPRAAKEAVTCQTRSPMFPHFPTT